MNPPFSLPSLPSGLDTLTPDHLTPHSRQACLALGIEPRELLPSATTTVARELLAAASRHAHSRFLMQNGDKDVKQSQSQHLEKRRQAKLASAIDRRNELMAHTARSSASDSAGSPLSGRSRRSTSSASNSDYLFSTLDRLQRQEARKQAQIAERQKRDLAQLVISEVKHAQFQHETERVAQRVEQQRKVERRMLAEKAREREAKRSQAESRIAAEQRRLEEEKHEIYERDRAEREQIRQRREAEVRQHKEWSGKRDRDRQQRLQATRAAEEERMHQKQHTMREKLQDMEVRAIIAKHRDINRSQIESRVKATGSQYRADSDEDELQSSITEKLVLYQHREREKRHEQECQHKQWQSRTERAREAQRKTVVQRQAALQAKEREMQQREVQRQQRSLAEADYYRSKEKLRIRAKLEAARATLETKRAREQSWHAKVRQLSDRETRLQRERDEEAKHFALRAHLNELDRIEHERRRERQTNYKRELQLTKITDSEARLARIEQQRIKSRTERFELLKRSEREKEKVLKAFNRMKGKIKGEIGEEGLSELGIPQDIIRESLKSTTGGVNGTYHRPSTSASAKRDNVGNAPSSPYILPVSRFAGGILTRAKSSGHQRTISLSSSSLSYLEPPLTATSKKPVGELTVEEKSSQIESFALRQNGELLMVVEKEQQREEERERLLVSVSDPVESERLEKVFAVERGLSNERIERLQRQHEITLAIKMQQLGMIGEPDDSARPCHSDDGRRECERYDNDGKYAEERKEAEPDYEATIE